MSGSGLSTLDLGGREADRHAAPQWRRRSSIGMALAAGCCAALLAGTSWRSSLPRSAAPEKPVTVRLDLAQAQAVAGLNVDDPAQIIAEGGDAETGNSRIPFAAGRAVPMGAFRLDAPTDTAANAFKCMTQAIYYEAATEPLEGRRAVAQVVLNRVRHPAYPKSVCGVIYQGAERSTGCQFSFACDGSLLRAPMAGPWREAEIIAREALDGKVEAAVGTATHYHADYVLPRWAFEMDKITRLGRHLFYRFEGTWGQPRFFAGVYSGREVIPALDFARLRARLLAAHVVPPAMTPLVSGLTVAPAVTDRHAANDVGGRLDMTREWRLSIPDPVEASRRYRAITGEAQAPDTPVTGGGNTATEAVR